MKKIIFTYLLFCAGFILAQQTEFTSVKRVICVAETMSLKISSPIFHDTSSPLRQVEFRPKNFWFGKKPIFFVDQNTENKYKLRPC